MNYTQYFETKIRVDTQKTFITCKESAPHKLKDFIRSVHVRHFDCLPNDWIYATILEAFEALKEDSFDNISIDPDIYYKDLYSWFGEPYAGEFCNEWLEENQSKNIWEIIAGAQYLARYAIYSSVNHFIENNKETA